MTSSGREDFFSKTLLFYCINDNSLAMHTFLVKKQKAKKNKKKQRNRTFDTQLSHM